MLPVDAVVTSNSSVIAESGDVPALAGWPARTNFVVEGGCATVRCCAAAATRTWPAPRQGMVDVASGRSGAVRRATWIMIDTSPPVG
jgi:hypothetical protein